MFKITNQKKLEDSSVEISVSIPFDEISNHRSHAIKHLGEHVEIDGFRKGHVPEKVLVSKFGEQAILEEAAECLIEETYGEIVTEAKIHPVAHPKIVITKIAEGNPFEFNLIIDVMPEFDLPDFKSIAKKAAKKEMIEVSEKEVEDVLNEIKKHHLKEGEEITDETVKTFGNFENVADFKKKIEENLKHEKEVQSSQKNRIEILKAIANESKIEIPNTFVERELDQMVNEFTHELARMGQTFENYKTHAKKTEDEIKNEWRDKARERVAHELILDKIVHLENIKPDPAEVEKEVSVMAEHYKEAPRERLVSFVEDMLTKREVFKILEKQNQ